MELLPLESWHAEGMVLMSAVLPEQVAMHFQVVVGMCERADFKSMLHKP
jgi:hypothetical protein